MIGCRENYCRYFLSCFKTFADKHFVALFSWVF